MANSQAVLKFYKSVIDDVITNVREGFLDEGVDEQVLQELKQIWESKLMLTRAVDPTPQPLPQANASNSRPTKSQDASSSSAQSADSQIQAQLQLQAVAEAQSAAAVGGSVVQQQGTQAFHIPGTTTQLSSSAAAATLAFQQGVLQLPHQLTSLPAGLTLAQPGVTQTFPAYTLSQPHGTLQAGAYQAVLPSGQTVMIQPTPQTTQTQQQQQQQQQAQQAGASINLKTVQARVLQVDGPNDTSDEEEDDDDEDDNDNDDIDNENDNDDNDDSRNDVEERPLDTDDDVSDEDPAELFETENVVVCQYDKINRSRNKWKFHLKNGIMNLKGRDYVFFKAGGDAEW